MPEKEIGIVSIYFSHVGVAAIELSDDLKIGDRIHVKGSTTDFEQVVNSMQIERKNVSSAKKGGHVGIIVSDKVRPNDVVFLVN